MKQGQNSQFKTYNFNLFSNAVVYYSIFCSYTTLAGDMSRKSGEKIFLDRKNKL